MKPDHPGKTQAPLHTPEGQIQTGERTAYWLDCKDIVTAVSSNWNRFALSNNAGESTLAPNVIGQSIYSFIASDPARMYLQVLIQQARLLGHVVTRKYRCDSPELKRYMEMRIAPEPAGQICLEHQLERVEPFAKPLAFRPAADADRNAACRCSICARLYLDGYWIMPEEAVTRELIALDRSVPVTYTVCPFCQPSPPPVA